MELHLTISLIASNTKASRTSGGSLFSRFSVGSRELTTSRSRCRYGLCPTATIISRIQTLASGAGSGGGNCLRRACCTASGSTSIYPRPPSPSVILRHPPSSSDEGDQLDEVDLGILVEIKPRVQFCHLLSIDQHQKAVLLET